MIGISAMRCRVGIWLAGLFFIAQILAVAALMSEHAAHVAESELGPLTESVITNTLPLGHHHHRGDADGFVQHHELQDLSGAFASVMSHCEIAFARVAATPQIPEALAGTDPALLERPPNFLLPV